MGATGLILCYFGIDVFICAQWMQCVYKKLTNFYTHFLITLEKC